MTNKQLQDISIKQKDKLIIKIAYHSIASFSFSPSIIESINKEFSDHLLLQCYFEKSNHTQIKGNQTIRHDSKITIYQAGEIIHFQKVSNISYELIEYLLTTYLDNHSKMKIENKLKAIKEANLEINKKNDLSNMKRILMSIREISKSDQRLLNIPLSLFIVLVVTSISIIFIKYSIEWATSSQSALNRLNDIRYHVMVKELNQKFIFVRDD